MGKKPYKEDPKPGVPAYMVSFGDMMTLILTFFILLVSMANEQNPGLMAKGLGSFSVAIQSFGLDGLMSESEKVARFNHYRRKFGLPPEPDPSQQSEDLDNAAKVELVPAELIEALRPRPEAFHPVAASFDADSSTLTGATRTYLQSLAQSLEPLSGQVLVLEGHANDAGAAHGFNNQRLAFARAEAVRTYLVETLDFDPERVEARGWLAADREVGHSVSQVDARLVLQPVD